MGVREASFVRMLPIMSHPIHDRVRRHAPVFFRFLISGGLGATVDFSVLLIGTRYFGWPAAVALFASGGLALLTVFTANKYFTFRRHDTHAKSEAWKFLLVYGTSALLNYFVSLLLIQFGLPEFLAKAGAIVILLGVNYVFLHGFVFKKKDLPVEDVILP